MDDIADDFCLKNSAYNTKKNFYAHYIVKFLNHVFNDIDTPIENINDLTIDMVIDFLERFSKGKLKNDNLDEWRSKENVENATRAVCYFVYWLCTKVDKHTKKKVYNMKYIKKSDFRFKTVTKRNKNGYAIEQNERLRPLKTIEVNNELKTRPKVKEASEYGVAKLIELAELNDPMLVFPIALGAFAGLRMGEVLQMHRGRIIGLTIRRNSCFFDLTKNVCLRSDNKPTGSIKVLRQQPIHEGTIDILRYFYLQHLDYLESIGMENNKYGALILNEKGIAMTRSCYMARFDKLNKLLNLVIKEEAMLGNKKAIIEDAILSAGNMTHHSLRHYFANMIKNHERGKSAIVQHFLQHSSIETQELYTQASTKEGIRSIQNSMYENFLKDRVK
ncbi:integrase [Clostridium perfringens]|nr:integrase [Clostridium perfringens]